MKSLLLTLSLLVPIAAQAHDGYAVITFGKDAPIKADKYPITDEQGWPFTDAHFDTLHIQVPKQGSYTAVVNVNGKPVCKVHVTKASKPTADCDFHLVCASQADVVISEVKGNPGKTGLALTYDRKGTRCDEVEQL